MIVFKKVKYLLASLLVASFVGLLQGAHEGTLSRGWSQVSNFGDKIMKHPVTPYAMAPVAAYAGALLSSKISDMGAEHLVI